SVDVLFQGAADAVTPPPNVESAVVRVAPRPDPINAADDEQGFRELVQGAFGMRRKQMRKVLRELQPMSIERAEGLLRSAGIDPEVRPETLSPAQFAALFRLSGAD